MNLSIIIPNFNGKELLAENLRYLLSSKNKISNTELIIVDNDSSDKSENLIKQNYPQVKYFKLNKNYGFSGACNCGAKESKGEHLLFLNNDCLISWNDIGRMQRFLKNNKGIVATQPIVFNKNREIENIGYFVDIKKAKASPVTNVQQLKNRKSENIFEKASFYGLSATCLLIKKDIFEKIGMFDEQFHSYLEDVDLFFRLAINGYGYSPCLTAKCFHEHMATSQRMGNYKQKQDFKNWIRIIIKNYPLKYKIKYFPSLVIERIRNLNGVIKSII